MADYENTLQKRRVALQRKRLARKAEAPTMDLSIYVGSVLEQALDWEPNTNLG